MPSAMTAIRFAASWKSEKKFPPKLRLAMIAAVIGFALGTTTTRAATLVVKVEAVSPKGGNVRVALYDLQSYEGHEGSPIADRVVPAMAPETIVQFEELPAGTYAIKMFQDINRNGEFDMNWIGLPAEPFGFSNDARPLFDQPSFDRTKFTVGNGRRTITIHLQHWLSEMPRSFAAQRRRQLLPKSG